MPLIYVLDMNTRIVLRALNLDTSIASFLPFPNFNMNDMPYILVRKDNYLIILNFNTMEITNLDESNY